MSREIVASAGVRGQDLYEPQGGQPPVNPLLLVHRALRGRYLLAIVLGVVLAVPFAVGAYFAVPPKYTSTGRINIAPTRPIILYENEFTERMSSFDSFIQSEANTLKSQRVLSAAAKNAELRAAGWKPLPQGLIDLTKATTISVPRGGQDIFVSVTWTDPKLAQAAANAILDEYKQIAVDSESQELEQKIRTIEELRESARQERDATRLQAYQLAEREGTDDLARLRDAKHRQVERLEAQLVELDLQLLPYGARAPAGAAADAAAEAGAPDEIPVAALAAQDAELAALLNRKLSLQMEISALREQFSPQHREIEIRSSELGVIETLIEGRAAVVRATTPGAVADVPMEEYLHRTRDGVAAMLANMRDEARTIGKLQLEIDKLREKAARADEKFREADTRLESLLVQKRDGQQGRITIPQRAEWPFAPSTDRRIPLAAMGALGGGGLGVGALVLLGLLNPRFRYVDDIESGTTELLFVGAIPELVGQDPEVRELMTSSVHQLRTSIDAAVRSISRTAVHVVTSATAGEGKSTISRRLAQSFALSGKPTLLIDADLIGHRLTSEYKLSRVPGFSEAVLGEREPTSVVHETGERNLWLMPVGDSADCTPGCVSVAMVTALLDQLRSSYGAIVIDTGPVLGSVEAQAIAAASDEILLVVARGGGVRVVRLAIERLSRLGAGRLGIVFNRATLDDLERSASLSTRSQGVSRRPADDRGVVLEPLANGERSREGAPN